MRGNTTIGATLVFVSCSCSIPLPFYCVLPAPPLQTNEGLRSRFNNRFTFAFDDYTIDELAAIYISELHKRHYRLSQGLEDRYAEGHIAGPESSCPQLAKSPLWQGTCRLGRVRLANVGGWVGLQEPSSGLRDIISQGPRRGTG